MRNSTRRKLGPMRCRSSWLPETGHLLKLVPKMAEGLRADGCTQVETGVIQGSVHYVVEDQPQAVADLIEQNASLHAQ